MKSATLVLVLASLTSCAAQPGATVAAAQSSSRQCFLASNVNGFSSVSDTIVDIQVGASRYYRLSLAGSCPNIAWRNRVALRTTGGSDWICQGLDAELIVPDPNTSAQRCLVTGIAPITKAEWLAKGRH
jgi:hypothetical protein